MNESLEGVIEVILFTVCIVNPDVMRFSHNFLIGIGTVYLAMKSQILNRRSAVKWLIVVQQPIMKCNEYDVYEYILIISKHQSTNFLSLVYFNLCKGKLSKVWQSKIYGCITEAG